MRSRTLVYFLFPPDGSQKMKVMYLYCRRRKPYRYHFISLKRIHDSVTVGSLKKRKWVYTVEEHLKCFRSVFLVLSLFKVSNLTSYNALANFTSNTCLWKLSRREILFIFKFNK